MIDRWVLLQGGYGRQISKVVFRVLLLAGGCYCKVVAVGRKAQLYLRYCSRHVVVIIKWLL